MSTRMIWRMVEPFETSFAPAGLRSPMKLIVPGLCTRCGRGKRYITPKPLVFEWEPGSDVIGDFTWPDATRVAVKRTVFNELAKRFRGFHSESVEMVQDPKLKRPERLTKRTKPRVWLPYTGPELVELWPEHTVSFLPETTIVTSYACDDCGWEFRNISGVESKSHVYSQEMGKLVPNLKPRSPGMGVFVKASELLEAPIFHVEEFTAPILCTDEVRAFIQSKGFTNIDFLEFGDVVWGSVR